MSGVPSLSVNAKQDFFDLLKEISILPIKGILGLILQFFALWVIVLLDVYFQEEESALFSHIMLVLSFDQWN